jgi:hypothetical protein
MVRFRSVLIGVGKLVRRRTCPMACLAGVVVLLCLFVIRDRVYAAAGIFHLREVSAFELAKQVPPFAIGQRCPCSEAPDPNVTAYPTFKSGKPIFGSVSLGDNTDRTDSSLRFCFAIDESGGTGQGYDRLYFDLNRDLDLTNDGMYKRMRNPPKGANADGLAIERQVFFEYVGVPLPFGAEGPRPLEVMPRLHLAAGGYGYVAFVTTKARRGRIAIADEKFDVLLGHNYAVTGWFDRPWTALHLMPDRGSPASWWGGDRLMAMHKIRDTFYCFSATPAGDTLTVRPYDGPLGTLEVAAGGRNLETMTIQGSLLSKHTAVAIGDVSSSGIQNAVRSSRLPEGDYLPEYVSVEYGDLRISLSNNYHTDGKPRAAVNRPPVYGIRIHADKPFVFDFSNTPEVLFALPAKDQRVKRGEELTVKAVLIDPALDFMIRGLDRRSDAAKPVSLDPKVVFARADGTQVAEGALPFG